MAEKCVRCRYAAAAHVGDKTPAIVCCDYIGHTGHARGCPPGEGCAKFTPISEQSLRRVAWRRQHMEAERRRAEAPAAPRLTVFPERERMYAEGCTDAQIAAAERKTVNAISDWRRRRGYAPNAARPE